MTQAVAVGNVVTAYVGNLYEVNPSSGVTATYYYAGSARIAMRTAAGLTYLTGDHLGSASLATNAAGQRVSDQRYLPYGATRSGGVPTDLAPGGDEGPSPANPERGLCVQCITARKAPVLATARR